MADSAVAVDVETVRIRRVEALERQFGGITKLAAAGDMAPTTIYRWLRGRPAGGGGAKCVLQLAAAACPGDAVKQLQIARELAGLPATDDNGTTNGHQGEV